MKDVDFCGVALCRDDAHFTECSKSWSHSIDLGSGCMLRQLTAELYKLHLEHGSMCHAVWRSEDIDLMRRDQTVIFWTVVMKQFSRRGERLHGVVWGSAMWHGAAKAIKTKACSTLFRKTWSLDTTDILRASRQGRRDKSRRSYMPSWWMRVKWW